MLARFFQLLNRTKQAGRAMGSSARPEFARPARSSSIVVGPSEPIVVGPSSPVPRIPAKSRGTGVLVRPPAVLSHPPRPIIQVKPFARGVWDEKGWVRERRNGALVYHGTFHVTGRRSRLQRRFAGQIFLADGKVAVYIADPPSEIKNHPKGPCFTRLSGNWFQLHWHRPARNVDEAILYVEKVLAEALAGGS